MGSASGFYSNEEFELDPKWLVDPRHLFVGPKIGEGAHAKVYEGKYRNQTVAIKIIKRGESPEEIAKRDNRFAREIAMLSKVQHKNLVKFIGACKEPMMVIVTELLLGGTLRKYLVSLRPKRLDIRLAVGFALDIARAMECLHSHGIIHRDLKPGKWKEI
jgi:serine/threonine protein kinase